MMFNTLTEAQQFFEQYGFEAFFRPYFSENGALLIYSQSQISGDGVKFFSRSLFFTEMTNNNG